MNLLMLLCLSIITLANETVPFTIVALGDSLTEGYGVEKDLAYPALVEQKFQSAGKNVRVVNAGISGSTSAGASSRLKWLLKSKPEVVFLALGANDGLRGVALAETKKNLRAAIQLAKDNKVRVFLAGMRLPPNYGKDYSQGFHKMYEELAREEKLPILPSLLSDVAGETKLNQPDGIHPNEEGHKKIAEQVYVFLDKNLKIPPGTLQK